MRIKIIALLCITISCGTFAGAQDFQKGLQAAQNGDFQAALIEWRPLAEQGMADAQYNLGLMYANGDGVVQDYQEALKWYRLAAEQGNDRGQVRLGLMYGSGRGVVQDYQEELKWYRLGAEQGNAWAQMMLGAMHGSGRGVVQDYVYAHMWFNIAASLGVSTGVEARDTLSKLMTNEQISQAQQLARECVQKNYKGC